ncbi:MAG TPA: signal peptide peptidase SppA [Syntrophomonadaceae bacterium]|nr:signal peptide peptidase SppA [Syntrophomonadaceae bacterium]
MGKKVVIAALVLFLLLMGILSLRTVLNPSKQANAQDGAGSVGIIRVEGTITGTASGGWSGLSSDADEIMAAIREAARRQDIKAVVLRVNSPGGSSVASQEIGIELDKLRKTGKPVVTSMGDACASGGYWIACSTDHIVANSTTLTGSIGVIMELSNLEGLYGKLGIRQEAIKSGQHKDMGSSARELSDEERQLLQDMVNDSYQQFLDQVLAGRKGKIDKAKLLSIADGRVLTGKQALDYGLVDSLGNYYDAVKKAQEMAGLNQDSQVQELNNTNFWDELIKGGSLRSVLELGSGPYLKY